MVQFRFPETPPKARHWWMVITTDDADVCDVDPGHPVAVTVSGGLHQHGRDTGVATSSWSDALGSGEIEVIGPEALRRDLPRWFTLSPFASVPRPSS